MFELDSQAEVAKRVRIADRIHRFPAKMSPNLARSFLASIEKSSGFRSNELKFHDPMCGSGTTALVARTLGFSVSAGDIMYTSSVIATAKLSRLSCSDLEDLKDFSHSVDVSSKTKPERQWKNWRVWYRPNVLGCLENLAQKLSAERGRRFFPHLVTGFFQTAWDVSSADKNVAVPTRSRFSNAPPKMSYT